MPFYENIFIARQDLSNSQVEQLADNFTEILSNNGGKVTKKEMWGLRTLAYKIKKNRKGHYVFFNVDAPPAAIEELERNMRINENILRHLTVKVEALEEGPSVVMQTKGERKTERAFTPGEESTYGAATNLEGEV